MTSRTVSFRVRPSAHSYTYTAEVYVRDEATLVIASANNENPEIFSAENDFSFVAAAEFANDRHIEPGRMTWFLWEGGAYYFVSFGIDGTDSANRYGNYFWAQRIPVHPSVVSGMIQAFTS